MLPSLENLLQVKDFVLAAPAKKGTTLMRNNEATMIQKIANYIHISPIYSVIFANP